MTVHRKSRLGGREGHDWKVLRCAADTDPVKNCKWMTVPSALVRPTLASAFASLLPLTTSHVLISPLPSTHKLTV